MKNKISGFLIRLAVRISPDFYKWTPVRGKPVNVIISNHAIDRVSQRCLDVWWDTREKDDGIYTWLRKQVTKAMNAQGMKNQLVIGKMQFLMEMNENIPVVTTVYPVAEANETPIKVCKKIEIV